VGGKAATQENEQDRERFMRANIDAMARKLGEMQARMMQLESLGNRVTGLAGMPPLDTAHPPGQGGALVDAHSLSMQELNSALDSLSVLMAQRMDQLTVAESRLFDQNIRKYLEPTQLPVVGHPVGSPFGWRIDPFTGQSALHTGLDFPAEVGTPVMAAAGGVVITQENNPSYGNMIEIDHGNHLVTRYAHTLRVFVKVGDIVRRGQKIAEVGTTGRSTGPHLHFEVWVHGVVQDPQRFLFAGKDAPQPPVAVAPLPMDGAAQR
jgi:murein DD-endopeptidase MepM/ murein hydrolase activator NlpD